MSEVFERVYHIVQAIPRGKVLTYGLISQMLGGRLSAQGVGWALNALSGNKDSRYHSENVPWQRVINSKGMVSTNRRGDLPPDLQRRLLEDEGIVFDENERIDLNRYLWKEGLSPPEGAEDSKG
ncbi:MAG TPA: MGMT family protein [Candidatus Melainabacteria bacterium]|nr:MGMT family protein [Candidatus Melainabacteria bacterium]HMP50966.1 MGMT family protein [Candidatus Melainabacteria bacterium]